MELQGTIYCHPKNDFGSLVMLGCGIKLPFYPLIYSAKLHFSNNDTLVLFPVESFRNYCFQKNKCLCYGACTKEIRYGFIICLI